MNRIIKFSIICLTFLFVSCGPSDEELLKNAESTVQSFADELNMQNFNSAEHIYPEFNKITRYKVLHNFIISSSKFTSDEKNEVKVIGKYGTSDNISPIQFILKLNESNKWKIVKSKGLSSYYKSDLYNAIKISGCFTDIESDVSIHQTCEKLKPQFEALVNEYKNKIENLIIFEKKGSNLTNNYNTDISGELMLKNNSNISIPGFSYDIYIVFYDRHNDPSYSLKYNFNYEPILANDYHQITIFSMDYHRDFKRYSALVKITNDQFIRSYLSRKGILNCSKLND